MEDALKLILSQAKKLKLRKLKAESDAEEDETRSADESDYDTDEETDAENPVQRPQRENKGILPARYGDYVMSTSEDEPRNFKEAQENLNRGKWFQAMQEELKSMSDNETWELMSFQKEGQPQDQSGCIK